MNYKFVESVNFEDFSGGRVIYHKAGFTNYPVRLACEIFMRCLDKINKAKVSIYDPCCGSGYILTVLGFLYGDRIRAIYGSDVSAEAVSLAEKNLGLLPVEGLLRRKEELKALYQAYGKDSHKQAVKSAERLLAMREMSEASGIPCKVFRRDVLAEKEVPLAESMDEDNIDIVITDIPYGSLVGWSTDGRPTVDKAISDPFTVDIMLENIKTNLNPGAIVAVSSDKRQRISNPAYERLEKFKIGKRKVEIMIRE